MEAMADTVPYAAVGSKASELAKAMIRELLLGQSVEGYCGNCGVIKNAEVPKYEVSFLSVFFNHRVLLQRCHSLGLDIDKV